jgi:hypothetical protein
MYYAIPDHRGAYAGCAVSVASRGVNEDRKRFNGVDVTKYANAN